MITPWSFHVLLSDGGTGGTIIGIICACFIETDLIGVRFSFLSLHLKKEAEHSFIFSYLFWRRQSLPGRRWRTWCFSFVRTVPDEGSMPYRDGRWKHKRRILRARKSHPTVVRRCSFFNFFLCKMDIFFPLCCCADAVSTCQCVSNLLSSPAK